MLWTYLGVPGAGLGAGPQLERRGRGLSLQGVAMWSTPTPTGTQAQSVCCRCLGWESLTLSQGDGDDNAVASAHPEAVARNEEGRDAHKGEAQLASAWGRDRRGGVSEAQLCLQPPTW